MKNNLANRIQTLESKMNAGDEHITINRIIIHTPEQMNHPERFTKKLISSKPGKSCTRNIFRLERKV